MRNLTGSGGTCWAVCNGPHHRSDRGKLFYLSQCHSARRCPAAFNAICFKHLATFWPNLQARAKCPWTDLTQNTYNVISTSVCFLWKSRLCLLEAARNAKTWECSYHIWLQDNTGVLFGNHLRVLVHKEHWPSFFTVLWPQVTWSWDRYLTQVLCCFLFPFIFLLSTSRSNWPETWLI